MTSDTTNIYMGIAIAALFGLTLYYICTLRREVQPSDPLLDAEEKQKALEQKIRENLSTRLDPHTIVRLMCVCVLYSFHTHGQPYN